MRSRPAKCMSSGREPMASPPGSATFASPVRASSGPSTQIEPRIRRTSSYGASHDGSVGHVDAHPVRCAPCRLSRHLATEPLEQLRA